MKTADLVMCLVLAAAAAAPPGTAQAGERSPSTYGIGVIVGNNTSLDPDLDPLAYADDDAFKYGWFLSFFLDQTTLLARPDRDTEALWRGTPHSPPTRDAVLDALDAAVSKAEERAAAGDDVVFYLVYSGHGNYDREGRGFLHLEDGKLTTRDLYYHVIGRSASFHVILVIDACNAGFLVRSRGSSDRRPAGASALVLEDYRNVGLVLSSSSNGEVKEWGRYLSGIFSHQVRSALAGAADADEDGKVSFGELAAFTEAANRQVENPVLKLTPYIRPPLDRPDLPLVDLAQPRLGRFVTMQFPESTRVSVVDDDLVPYADFRTEKDFHARIALPGDSGFRIVVEGTREYAVTPEMSGTIGLESLSQEKEGPLASRGKDEYFTRNLFQVPYGAEFASGYLAGEYEASLVFVRPVERPWYENGWGWAAAGAGVALSGVAAYYYSRALSDHDAAAGARWADDIDAYNRSARENQWIALGTGIAGSAALVGATALFLLDRPVEDVQIAPRLGPVGLAPASGGALLSMTY